MSNNKEIVDDLEEEINQTDLPLLAENGIPKNGIVKKVTISIFVKH